MRVWGVGYRDDEGGEMKEELPIAISVSRAQLWRHIDSSFEWKIDEGKI